ncbi:MAG: RraA family protein [Kiritimatiellae bacterium]|nr:RraA family protein [Kiritimatiellia bacterium]
MVLGCRIYDDFKRPDKELVEKFASFPVANIDDCYDRYFAMRYPLRLMSNTKRLVGVAYTVKVPQGDNLMLNKAMDLAKPGDVLIVDAGGFDTRAIFGEIIVSYCKKRGIKGIVVDGAIRDSDAINEMTDFSVYAKGVAPDGPYHNGPGMIGTAVCCAGQVVFPGDIIVGDADGVIAIRPDDALEVIAKAEAIGEKERALLKGIDEEGVYPRPWVDKRLTELGCI